MPQLSTDRFLEATDEVDEYHNLLLSSTVDMGVRFIEITETLKTKHSLDVRALELDRYNEKTTLETMQETSG
ncbi:hypothetical protein A9Q83_04340 [Alphaproteobacteria bacterium 46_93_T64]|nr:hypothetical protein A9Q83_04340 [Alphaproteobacteria bacterium 46_93_T64]